MSKRFVLDTTVIVKGLLKPYQRLPAEIYDRELETHHKCKFILDRFEKEAFEIYIPLVCVVEVAAVFKRLTGKEELALSVSSKIREIYFMVSEEKFFDEAWKTAAKTGSSGFDSYFLALAKIMDATLITDDENMSEKGSITNTKTILVRKTSLKKLEEQLK
ncbi:MAG: type II toxin-antitoxin system VapC family toxin [Candidatus Freyarchaeum deiterrae]